MFHKELLLNKTVSPLREDIQQRFNLLIADYEKFTSQFTDFKLDLPANQNKLNELFDPEKKQILLNELLAILGQDAEDTEIFKVKYDRLRVLYKHLYLRYQKAKKEYLQTWKNTYVPSNELDQIISEILPP